MSKFAESLESRQMASATPVNFDTQTHTVTDDAVVDYTYHAKGVESSNGSSRLGFSSVLSSQFSDGSTSRDMMIGSVTTKKNGVTTIKYIEIVTSTGTSDAQNYFYVITLSRDANGNVLTDSTQTKKFK